MASNRQTGAKPSPVSRIANPLTDKQLAILNQLIQATAETAQFCDKCTACQLDVTPEARQNAEQQRIAVAIKAAFFPDAP